MDKEQKLYTEIGNSLKDAVESQMFGKPCFKINNKAFICFFQNCLVCKLTGDEHAAAMKLKGAVLFDPSGKGRAMKEWMQIPYDHKAKWKGFAQAALEYVGQ
ncbi:hypothetical protein [Polluticoccus soli]|uniref:hypothetical protein n=1 Tax=Polluticoccus soli TaxID=3034150 RepID=UPI0023E2FFE8|nr:hypothetical protein [Flavipsychrobacter sp. JY13-12]